MAPGTLPLGWPHTLSRHHLMWLEGCPLTHCCHGLPCANPFLGVTATSRGPGGVPLNNSWLTPPPTEHMARAEPEGDGFPHRCQEIATSPIHRESRPGNEADHKERQNPKDPVTNSGCSYIWPRNTFEFPGCITQKIPFLVYTRLHYNQSLKSESSELHSKGRREGRTGSEYLLL